MDVDTVTIVAYNVHQVPAHCRLKDAHTTRQMSCHLTSCQTKHTVKRCFNSSILCTRDW